MVHTNYTQRRENEKPMFEKHWFFNIYKTITKDIESSKLEIIPELFKTKYLIFK